MLEEGRTRQRERERSHVAARALTAGISRSPRSRHDSGEGRSRLWGPAAWLAVAIVGASAAVVAAGAIGRGPLQQIAWQEKRLQPQTAQVSGERSIKVGFALDADDSCGGSFTVRVSETPDTVVVGEVVHRVPRVNVVEPECTLPVPADGQVFATVDLSQPLNGRQVIRAQDRQLLAPSP